MERPVKTPSKGFFYGKEGNEGSSQASDTNGTLGKTGELGLRILKGKRRRKKLDTHRGIPNPDGKDIVAQRKLGGESSCPLKNVRIIKKNIGMYLLSFEIPHNVKSGRIELVTVGPESVKFILFCNQLSKQNWLSIALIAVFFNSLIRGHFEQNFCKNGYTK